MALYGRRGGWRFFEPPAPLSILELVKYGTVDLRLASLFWLMMERRASVVVAAGPSGAGKSTVLNVMLDFLRPEVKQIELQGDYEDFSFLKSARPATSYLVAAEFGSHGYYVWGEVAIRAFELIARGYALGGTIHARTAKEVVEIFHRYLGLPMSGIARIDAVVTLSVSGGRSYYDEPVRRIHTVSVVSPHNSGLALELIASFNSKGDSFSIASADDLRATLGKKLNVKNTDVARETKEKEQFLARLLEAGRVSQGEVRQAVVDYYRSRPA